MAAWAAARAPPGDRRRIEAQDECQAGAGADGDGDRPTAAQRDLVL